MGCSGRCLPLPRLRSGSDQPSSFLYELYCIALRWFWSRSSIVVLVLMDAPFLYEVMSWMDWILRASCFSADEKDGMVRVSL